MKLNNRLVIGAIGAMLAACYDQVPLQTYPPPPATHFTAQLTDSGTVVVGNALGPGVTAVEGIIEKADQQTWQLHVLSVDEKDGRTVDWNRELVSIPASVLTQPQVRVLNKKKSWLTVAAIAGGAFVLARSFSLLGANGDKEQTTGPAASVVPLPAGGGR